MKTGIKVALGVGVGIYAGIGIVVGGATELGQKLLTGKSKPSTGIVSGITWPVTLAKAAPIMATVLEAFK